MILQVRGTSGSGKSHAVREFMKRHDWIPHTPEGKRVPMYYSLVENERVIVFGNYGKGSGASGGRGKGGDRVGSPDFANLVRETNPALGIVEGLLLSEDVVHTLLMDEPVCLFLTTPLETCLERVRVRQNHQDRKKNREIRNPEGLIKKVIKRFHAVERNRLRLIKEDVPCYRRTGEQVVQFLERRLGEFLERKRTRGVSP